MTSRRGPSSYRLMVIRMLALVAASSSAAAEKPSRPFTVHADVSGVVASPRSSIAYERTGLGARVTVGVEGEHLGFWIGYRRLWTEDPIFQTSIWTIEKMLGMRLASRVSPRLACLLDVYLADVVLDSTGNAPAWHHKGTGVGGRAGLRFEVLPHGHALAAVGGSFAETEYEDEMGVGWVSLELGVATAW